MGFMVNSYKHKYYKIWEIVEESQIELCEGRKNPINPNESQ